MNKRIIKAREFAIKAHGNQKYNSNKPYIYHLDAVVKILEPYGEDAQIIGYLHDVIEDTDVSLQELEDEFGLFISVCVYILTDPVGPNRKDRKKGSYYKMSRAIDEYAISLIVKAADRLANLEHGGKTDMYKKEHSEFKMAAFRPGLCNELWEKMDKILGTNNDKIEK